MKTFLGVALFASLLLNAVLLLQRPESPSEPIPAPALVRTQIVERVVEPPPQAPPLPPDLGESIPRTLPTIVAEPPVVVTRPTVSLLASPGYAAPGGEIAVQLIVSSGEPAAKHWIGLYAVQAPVTNYLQYRMAGSGPFIFFQAPKIAGDYEFRYILEDDRTAVAVSNAVRVMGEPAPPPRVELHPGVSVVKRGAEIPALWTSFTGRRSPRDWVGVFAADASHHEFSTWKYVPEDGRGPLVLQAPDKPGIYELRYLLDNGYECVAVSSRIVVVD